MRDKIVVIGSSNVDMIMKMDHLPRRGETVTDAEFYQVYGGKGANQAVAAARAGGKVAFINCVGEDAYTPQMLQHYRDDGIDIRYVFQEKGLPSGHALVMIGAGGENYLSVAPGANYRLTPARIDAARPLLDEAAIILMQYEIPVETLQYVIDLAQAAGIPLLWNFAPARDFDRRYLPKVRTLVLNESEAAYLSGLAVTDRASAEAAARHLLAQGVKQVIITLGVQGALVMTASEQVVVPAYAVAAVDTTGAGDTFCGSFAVAQVEGQPLRACLEFASAAAALSVTRMGAQPSIPRRAEIEAFLRQRVG